MVTYASSKGHFFDCFIGGGTGLFLPGVEATTTAATAGETGGDFGGDFGGGGGDTGVGLFGAGS